MKERTQSVFKSAILVVAIVALAALSIVFISTAPPLDKEELDRIIPQIRYENGYEIKTIAGQDYIVTHDADGSERLTLLPHPVEQPQVTPEK